ncbi:hydantoinase/oxoprolinase family protein [Mumia qirimensis]|uniref:hydantoinase/oxoprolinase family protein n=1 Tax=Mumia qirimensis TaxID=3234852 RepID=UPI00351D27D1
MDSTGLCIGVDVGGTFTDVVLGDGATVWRAKAATTPHDLGEGVLAACRLVAERVGSTLEALLPRVDRFGLGTTAVTNAIASRAGRRVGLITTAGFEDLMPIARAMRIPSDGWLLPPPALVSPANIVGVTERVDRYGSVLKELDPAELGAAGRHLVDDLGVEAVVVSFLWAPANDKNERLAVDLLRRSHPGLAVVSAAELLPIVREFERTQFALLNAYTSGALTGVERLVSTLMDHGLRHPPLLVHSGGGSVSVHEAGVAPAILAESGPAAGVVAALEVCRAAGVTEAVSGDMGGTSYDVSFISGGEPARRTRGNLMGFWTAMPMIDIDSVGAGGGSIAWVDSVGMLQVGPQSAGADPGPICYGRGGEAVTVTDALVVLGFVDPNHFLGGGMALDAERARQACAELGERLGSNARDVAWGVWEIARANMVRALRARFAERGADPRAFTLVSMGGCGGLANAEIASALGIRRVLVPELASVLSAFGASTSDVRRERSRSVTSTVPAPQGPLDDVLADLVRGVRDDLAADGIDGGATEIVISADLRFSRQKFEHELVWQGGMDADNQERQAARFRAEYESRYGQGALVSGAPVEVVTLRATGIGRTVRATLVPDPRRATEEAEPRRQRDVQMVQGAAPAATDVYDRSDLLPGHRLSGPVVIDSDDTTTWVPEGFSARLDEFRTIVMEDDRS